MSDTENVHGIPFDTWAAVAKGDEGHGTKASDLHSAFRGDEPRACEATTRRGKPCPIVAWQSDLEGRFLCHVHHPEMRHMQEKPKRRAERLARKRNHDR